MKDKLDTVECFRLLMEVIMEVHNASDLLLEKETCESADLEMDPGRAEELSLITPKYIASQLRNIADILEAQYSWGKYWQPKDAY